MNIPLNLENPVDLAERQLLIIDDNETIRRQLVRLLSRIFSHTSQAGNFESARAALSCLAPGGIVVADLDLESPDIDDERLELARISLEQRQRLQQVFVLQSGNVSWAALQKIDSALREGTIDSFLAKPFSPSQLLNNIQETLSKK